MGEHKRSTRLHLLKRNRKLVWVQVPFQGPDPEPSPVPWLSPKQKPPRNRKLSHDEFWKAEREFRKFVRSPEARDMERRGREVLRNLTVGRFDPSPMITFRIEAEDADTQSLIDEAWRDFDEQRDEARWQLAQIFPRSPYYRDWGAFLALHRKLRNV